MRSSFGFAVPSVIVALSAVLLCSSTAFSQPTPNSSLPAVSVEAPKARTAVVPTQGPTTATSHHHHYRASESSTAQNPVFAPNTVLGKIARLEKSATSCNGGCEVSYRVGNAPWVGCSQSGERDIGAFSTTCRDTLNYNTYAQCIETKTLLGATSKESRWLCSSLQAGGKLPGERQFAEGRR